MLGPPATVLYYALGIKVVHFWHAIGRTSESGTAAHPRVDRGNSRGRSDSKCGFNLSFPRVETYSLGGIGHKADECLAFSGVRCHDPGS